MDNEIKSSKVVLGSVINFTKSHKGKIVLFVENYTVTNFALTIFCEIDHRQTWNL